MGVVAVDPRLLDGPAAPLALSALVDDLGDEPTLLCFDGAWPRELEPATRAAVRRLPALSIAVACPSPEIAANYDIAVDGPAAFHVLRQGFEAAPYAAVAAALLLREKTDSTSDTFAGLVAESSAYSLLQSGPEFRAWLAHRCTRTASRDEGPRIRVERRGSVAEIVLTRAARHNAFDARMRDELHAALRELAARAGPIVLRADGPSFSSGGDLDEFGTAAGPVQAHVLRVARSVAMVMSELAPRMVVALHGACIGAGIELPAFASCVVAADDARIALPELRLGLVPGAGGTVSIRRRIGPARLLQLLLSGRTLDAHTARSWGLVDEVVPRAELLHRAYTLAERR